MNDREFDALLESAAPELPPDDVARDVTPWRRAIGNILGGSAMCSITLNFFCLNYLLPTIGVILQLLGFRPLRRENGWFRACWLLAILRAALFLPCIVLNATIYSNAVYASSVGTALTYGTVAAQLLLFFCFWRALRAVRQKAGTEVRVGSAAAYEGYEHFKSGEYKNRYKSAARPCDARLLYSHSAQPLPSLP